MRSTTKPGLSGPVRNGDGEFQSSRALTHQYDYWIDRYQKFSGPNFMARARRALPGASFERMAVPLALAMQRKRDKDLREQGTRGLIELADAGVNIARYNVALLHLSGEHRAPSFKKAIRLLRAVVATEQADPCLKGLALKGLGDCHVDGRGLARDAAKGHRLYEYAAAYGVAEAAFNVGVYHDDKNFTSPRGPVDLPKAATFYLKAVDRGYVPAMTNLGVLYVAGLVKEPAADYGWELLSRAADLGDDVAATATSRLEPSRVPARRGGLSAIASTRL